MHILLVTSDKRARVLAECPDVAKELYCKSCYYVYLQNIISDIGHTQRIMALEVLLVCKNSSHPLNASQSVLCILVLVYLIRWMSGLDMVDFEKLTFRIGLLKYRANFQNCIFSSEFFSKVLRKFSMHCITIFNIF